jgi:hypothetical protein
MGTNKEIWKRIEGYDDYEISNFGRVKSFKNKRNSYGKILKPTSDTHGYLHVHLCKDEKVKTAKIHQLVAIAFLNYKPDRVNSVVNHIDGNKTNNYLSNLEIVTSRKNTNEFFRLKSKKLTSKFPGVYWNKFNRKWRARITIKGKQVFNKHFASELEAAAAYQSKLIELGLN